MIRQAILALLCASSMLAASTLLAHDKIAIADWRGALFQTRLAAEANQILQQRTQRDREQLQDLERNIAERQQLLERDALIITEGERQQMLNIIRNEQNTYLGLVQRLEQQRLEAENVFFQRHQGIVEQSLRELALEHEVSVILDVQAVIFADKTLNLTDELLAVLNSKLQGNTPRPQTTPPSADLPRAPTTPSVAAPDAPTPETNTSIATTETNLSDANISTVPDSNATPENNISSVPDITPETNTSIIDTTP